MDVSHITLDFLTFSSTEFSVHCIPLLITDPIFSLARFCVAYVPTYRTNICMILSDGKKSDAEQLFDLFKYG